MATQIGSGTTTLATYIPDLTDVSDITVALKQMYYGTTAGTLSTTTGIYGALYTLYTGNPTLAGNVTITGNLTVNGSTTNINSTTLVVEDKNVVLADVTTPTNTTADGAGLTVSNGATNPTWLYNYNNVTNGTAAWTSNIPIATNALYVGTGTFPNYNPGAGLLSFGSASIIGKGGSSTYAQIAMINTNSGGSADFAAYGDNGDDASGWADMGFTGSAFSDANYTITGQNDGYFLVSARSGAVKSGNLVLGTSGNGTSNAIIFGTGGFAAANERLRINSTGKLTTADSTTGGTAAINIGTGSTSSTGATTGALNLSTGTPTNGTVSYSGAISIATGNASGSSGGNGGSITITAGNGAGSSGGGGSIALNAGSGVGTGSVTLGATTGNVTIGRSGLTSTINGTLTLPFITQGAITAISTAGANTLTIAQILTQVITVTQTVGVTLTLPTAALTDAGIQGGVAPVNTAFDWSVINTGSSAGAVTMAAGTSHTYVGNTTVAINTSARFRTVRTAATPTFVTYRIA